MIGSGEPGRPIARAGWIILLLPLLVVLGSLLVSPESTWIMRVGLGAFCVLAVIRPDDALLVAIALIGFGNIVSHLLGMPLLRTTEVLVVASIAGCCVRAVPRGGAMGAALARSTPMAAVLLAMTAVASTIVWLRVDQVQTGYAPPYLKALLHFVTHDYFFQRGEFLAIVAASVLLEGLALYAASAAYCRADPTFFPRALRMLAIGGAGLAMMSVVRVAEIQLRSPGAIAAMRASYAGLRISPQIPDYIAAGSYFALCWLVSLGIAITAPKRRLAWMCVGLLLLVGLYLTGSRSVVGAAVGGVAVLALVVVRRTTMPVRGVVIAAVIAVLVMVVTFPWIIGHDVLGETAKESLKVRFELLKTGVRVFATRPIFGVGIDRFWISAGSLASPLLNALWAGRKNPHNDFVRVGAELGAIGLALFVWILATAGRQTWRAIKTNRDARLAGVAGGLVAFLITSLFSNPLMLREVSFAFWIALGLAAGHSAQVPGEVTGAPRPDPPGRLARQRWPTALLLGAVLIVSIPWRASQELASTDLSHVSYGLSDWGTEPDGTPFRWSGPQVTFFVDRRATLVTIPLRGSLPSGVVQQVEIRVDGRPANRVAIGTEWQRLRTPLPATSSAGARRIDLVITPSWVPAEVLPGNEDRRVLGVKVGEIQVLVPSQPRSPSAR